VTGEHETGDALAGLDPLRRCARLLAGEAPRFAGTRDQLAVLGAEEPLEPAADLTGDGGTAAPGRDGDLKLAVAEHGGHDEVAVLRPVDHVRERPPSARRSGHHTVDTEIARRGDGQHEAAWIGAPERPSPMD